MKSPRTGSMRRSDRRRWSLLAGAAVLGLLPATGCQVEYAGMTLPSGKYMHDDVQYFAQGPAFPWANTQAETQRARMSAMGMTPPPQAAGVAVPGGTFVPGAMAPGMANPNAVGNQFITPPVGVIGPGPGGGAPGATPIQANPGGIPAGVANPNPIAPPVAPGTTPPVPPAPGSPS